MAGFKLKKLFGFASGSEQPRKAAVPDLPIDALIEKSWSGRGGSREGSRHGRRSREGSHRGHNHYRDANGKLPSVVHGLRRVSIEVPPSPSALGSLHLAAFSSSANLSCSPSPRELRPAAPAAAPTAPATAPTAPAALSSDTPAPGTADTADVCCSKGSTAGRLRRTSSTPSLPACHSIVAAGEASREPASPLHKACSTSDVRLCGSTEGAPSSVPPSTGDASRDTSVRCGCTRGSSTAADLPDARPPRLVVEPTGSRTPKGGECLSPTLSLLSVQLRSGAASVVNEGPHAESSAPALGRVSALSHALSGFSSRETSARGGAFGASRLHSGGPSREASARGGKFAGPSREASARGGAFAGGGSREPSARGGTYGRLAPPLALQREQQDAEGGGHGAEPMTAAERLAAAAAAQAGSWASRMTTYTIPRPDDSAEDAAALAAAQLVAGGAPACGGSAATAAHRAKFKKGPVNPVELTVALQALAGSGGGAGNVLVGDCDFATQAASAWNSGDPLGGEACGAARGGGTAGAAGATAGLHVAGTAAAAQEEEEEECKGLPMAERAQGDLAHSAPGQSCPLAEAAAAASVPPRSLAVDSDVCDPQHPCECPPQLQQPRPELSAQDRAEWQRSFQRRWKAVRKRAFLQGLGIRTLWKVSSPESRHEPLDLLLNDASAALPSRPIAMRRTRSSSGLPASLRRQCRSSEDIHRDPSLACLLLGEVAEVTG